jgi:hypothetical protein
LHEQSEFVEGQTEMKLLVAAVLAATCFVLTTDAIGSTDDLFNRIVGAQKKIDADKLVSSNVAQILQPNCDISAALQAALNGDNKAFGAALSRAEENLRGAAKNLKPLAQKKLYGKPVKLPPSLLPQSGSLGSSPTGDQVLGEIARLADESADALEKIKSGTGGETS